MHANDLPREVRLLLLSCGPDTTDIQHPAPSWLIDVALGLALIMRDGAGIRLTARGVAARADLLDIP